MFEFMKNFYYLIGLLVGLAILVVVQMPTAFARMVVCDIGQGDAILITKGMIQVLVDGGPSTAKILSCLEKYVPFYDRTIELVVLTNTDYDHLNGLNAVVDRYRILQFVSSDGVHPSDTLTKFVDKLGQSNLQVTPVERGDTILVREDEPQKGLRFDVLWPPDTVGEYVSIFDISMASSKREAVLGASDKRGDLNERSVILLLTESNKKILLTGDIGEETEELLIEMGQLPDIDILKVGHHGSRYASSDDFLSLIRPELSIISAGKNNSYGHPTDETLNRLSKIGSVIKRTDEDGDVIVDLQ